MFATLFANLWKICVKALKSKRFCQTFGTILLCGGMFFLTSATNRKWQYINLLQINMIMKVNVAILILLIKLSLILGQVWIQNAILFIAIHNC